MGEEEDRSAISWLHDHSRERYLVARRRGHLVQGLVTLSPLLWITPL